jgi:two-component system, NtrC family, nitrogen regulation response regulator NtrX
VSTILIIDDEPGIRTVLADVLKDEGYTVISAEDGAQGLSLLAVEPVDLVFLDVWLPRMGGIDVLKRLRAEHPDVEVIMISGHANISLAVQAAKMGAFDFLEKPLSLERTITVARNALALESLRRENRSLRDSIFIEDRMIGDSPAMRGVRELVGQAAGSESRILILGENGTGKELVAREVHRQSARAAGPFVELNCAAIPENLIESELFGHEKGAFTSALARRKGRFELADGGTLFLDEIADMSLATQARVLRVLQEMRFERIGGEEQISVDVRVISATNRDVGALTRAGKFREDLFFRIAVVPIVVPPLRERLEDLPALIAYFMEKFKRPSEKRPRTVSAEALELLAAYRWPGNIRELKNFVERVNIMTEEPEIQAASVRAFLGAVHKAEDDGAMGAWAECSLAEARDSFERQLIAVRLRQNGGNVSRTAQSLGLYASNLHSKMKKLKMRVEMRVEKHETT